MRMAVVGALIVGGLTTAAVAVKPDGSGAFGDEINRADKAQELLEELAELNMKAREEELSKEEMKHREKLQKIFGTTPDLCA